MGTYECALVTLDTFLSVPGRNGYCRTAFFVCGCAKLKLSVRVLCKCRNRKAVAIHDGNRIQKILYHLNGLRNTCIRLLRRICRRVLPGSRNFYFMYCVYAGVDCLIVHLYNRVAFLAVGFLCCCFHKVNCFFDRHNVCQFEECRLQNRIGTFAHTDFDCFVNGVDGVKLDVVVRDVFLRVCV